MSLCAGRDVINNNLGEPDQWSFLTHGRIWVNQGWLSHLFLYSSYLVLQEWGPLLTRALLLIISLTVIMVMSLRLGASAESVLLAMTLGTLGTAPLMSIRAENFAVLYFVLLTSILTASASWGGLRYCFSLLVILVWANSHGTFLLGCAMIGVRTAVAILRDSFSLRISPDRASAGNFWNGLRDHDTSSGQASTSCDSVPHDQSLLPLIHKTGEAWKWAITSILSMIVVAFANPYGSANLTMAFHQVEAGEWHKVVSLWQPLIVLSEFRLYYDKAIIPFAGFTLLTLLLLAFAVATGGISQLAVQGNYRHQYGQGPKLLTCVAIWIMAVCVTLRFGRAALFAVMANIPVAAFLFHFWIKRIGTWLNDKQGQIGRLILKWVPMVLSIFLLIFTGFVLTEQTLMPLLPTNPMVSDLSVSRRILGPLATNTEPLKAFMRNNDVGGRTFANWALADVLLFQVPSVKIFLDCRAQSMYSDADLDDYRAIIKVKPNDVSSESRSLSLLDRHEVSNVVLANNGVENPSFLVDLLLRSDRWSAIFVDPFRRGFVFVRRNVNESKDVGAGNGIPSFWYPDLDTKTVSSAFIAHGRGHRITPAILNDLKGIVRKQPSRFTYRAIAVSARMGDGCLDKDSRGFLLSELNRLSRMDMFTPRWGYAVLQSQLEIISRLQEEPVACHGQASELTYAKITKSILDSMGQMRKAFLPWGFDVWQWP